MDPKRFHEIIDTLYLHRRKDSIKSDFGRTLIIGGSLRYPLSVLISAKACYFSSNGYTALCVPKEIYVPIVSRMNPTQIIEPLVTEEGSFDPNQDLGMLNRYDSLLFGNGVEDSMLNRAFLRRLLEVYSHNLILDATGLKLLSEDLDMLERRNTDSTLLLTPHMKEASLLFKREETTREPEDLAETATVFCRRYHLNLLLKSAHSIYFTSEGLQYSLFYEDSRNLAKAGSGDGLSGYLAGILAYGDKKVGYDDAIRFADLMVHHAANEALKKKGMTSSVLDAIEEIENLTKE